MDDDFDYPHLDDPRINDPQEVRRKSQAELDKEYYDDLAWQKDRMDDGSDEQPYEPEVDDGE